MPAKNKRLVTLGHEFKKKKRIEKKGKDMAYYRCGGGESLLHICGKA